MKPQKGWYLEITLQHMGGARFLAESRHHRVVVDQPVEDGATDSGMTPAEFLLVALGSSVGQHVSQYLRMRNLPSDGLVIRVAAGRVSKPLRLTDFQVEIIAPVLSEPQLRALEKSFPAGLVYHSLSHENNIRITAATGREGDGQP